MRTERDCTEGCVHQSDGRQPERPRCCLPAVAHRRRINSVLSYLNGGIMNSCRRINALLGCTGLIGAVLTLTPLAASAQNAPLSYVANPGVYKVLAENDQFRVVLATWKPGQRD